MRRLSERVTEAYYLPADARVGRRLAELAGIYDGAIPIRQEQLAELAGTSRATANRVLRELEARGIVELGRRTIVVCDPKRLTRRIAADDG